MKNSDITAISGLQTLILANVNHGWVADMWYVISILVAILVMLQVYKESTETHEKKK